MKILCFFFFFLTPLTATVAKGQGLINFNTRVPSGSGAQAPVVAPIFGVDPGNPTRSPIGNPTADWNGTNGPTPVPVGTQTYGGSPLAGTGFSVGLWGGVAGVDDIAGTLIFVASMPFRTSTTPSLHGFWQIPAIPPAVPGVPFDPNVRAEFQMRVWDNHGGVFTTWEQLLNDY